MILRLLRARVKAGEEARLAQFIRDDAVAPALQTNGLLSFQPAIRQTPDGLELLIASTWSQFDDLVRGRENLDSPLTLPGAAAMLEDPHAEHYELVIGQARSMPLREAKLRLTRIPIVKGLEASYYEAIRFWADCLLDEHGMVAFSLGRRVSGRQDEIVAVQVFQDEHALKEVAGRDIAKPIGEKELSRFWDAAPAIEHFDALTATKAMRGAPAVVLMDDHRRYVHATPAAASIIGRPLARLLTMRLEDLAREDQREDVTGHWQKFMERGSMSGPAVVDRPDGSQVPIRFAARTNAPWPGSHASVLVADEPAPATEEATEDATDLDVDRALVAAGLVARYSNP